MENYDYGAMDYFLNWEMTKSETTKDELNNQASYNLGYFHGSKNQPYDESHCVSAEMITHYQLGYKAGKP